MVDVVVFVWDVEEGRLQWELRAPSASLSACVHDLAVSHGGERIFARGSSELFVWDGSTGELRRRLTLPRSGHFIRFAFLPGGGRFVATTNSDAAVWDTETGERVIPLEGGVRMSAINGDLAVSPCGRVAAMCASTGLLASLTMWDARSGRVLFRTGRRAAEVSRVCRLRVAPMATMADEFID